MDVVPITLAETSLGGPEGQELPLAKSSQVIAADWVSGNKALGPPCTA